MFMGTMVHEQMVHTGWQGVAGEDQGNLKETGVAATADPRVRVMHLSNKRLPARNAALVALPLPEEG